MIGRHIVIVLRYHKVTSDWTLQVIFLCEFLYGKPLPLTSIPIIRGDKKCIIKYAVVRRYNDQHNVYSPSTQSSFVKGNSALILLINEKHVAMFPGIFWRSRTDVLCQNFALSYIFLRYISHEPVSELSIVSSSSRRVRIYNIKHVCSDARILWKKCLYIRSNEIKY